MEINEANYVKNIAHATRQNYTLLRNRCLEFIREDYPSRLTRAFVNPIFGDLINNSQTTSFELWNQLMSLSQNYRAP